MLVAGLVLALAGSAHAAPVQRTSLPDVEDEVMCVLCGTPLNISESSQADLERRFIRRQIALGKTKDQVKQALKAEYGAQVLAMPSGGGFNAAAWLVPAAIVAALLAALAIFVPRWRNRPPSTPSGPQGPALSADDTRRLDEDIARYER